MNAPSGNVRDRLFAAVLFAAIIVAGGLSTQCRMVTDTASSGGGVTEANAGNCMQACAQAYADSNKVESRLHVANVHACNGDAACEAAEDARHDAAMARISAGRQACQTGCHAQGSGKGGR